MKQSYFALIVFFAALLLACARSYGVENHERLTWGPIDFLSQGFATAPWVRDPFYPAERPMTLGGVISNELAYINGQWVRPGETIEGYKVKSISTKGVTLVRGGDSLLLTPGE